MGVPNLQTTGGLLGVSPGGTPNGTTIYDSNLSTGANGEVLTANGDGTLTWAAGGGGGGTPAGPNNSVQVNNAGSFGGSAALLFTDLTNASILTIGKAADATAVIQPGNAATTLGINAGTEIDIRSPVFSFGSSGATAVTYTGAAGILRGPSSASFAITAATGQALNLTDDAGSAVSLTGTGGITMAATAGSINMAATAGGITTGLNLNDGAGNIEFETGLNQGGYTNIPTSYLQIGEDSGVNGPYQLLFPDSTTVAEIFAQNDLTIVAAGSHNVLIGSGTGGVMVARSAIGKVGFYGTAPIVQVSGATLTTAADIIAFLQSIGLLGA